MQACYKISVSLLSILCCALFFLSATAQDSLIVSGRQKEGNSIGIKYDLIAFDKAVNKPWHLVSLEYIRQIKKMPLIARINYANRFTKSGLQFEVDAYPVISKKIYTYVSVGYSKNLLLFPKYRAGASLYISLPHAFEAEAGFRFLYFSSPTWIYTTSIGKYYKKYWFNFGTFLTSGSNGVLQSYFLKTRYYLNDKDYVMLTLGTGISPDDTKNNILINTNANLNSKKAEVTFRNTIKKRTVIFLNVGWMSQEYEHRNYTHQYNMGIGIQKNL